MGKQDIEAFLGSGTSFHGQLTFEGVVRIDGVFEGEIASAGTLVVGHGARVAGTVSVGRLACDGELTADVVARDGVVIHAAGRISGSLRTPSLQVEEGGRIEGEVTMEPLVVVSISGPGVLPAHVDESRAHTA